MTENEFDLFNFITHQRKKEFTKNFDSLGCHTPTQEYK